MLTLLAPLSYIVNMATGCNIEDKWNENASKTAFHRAALIQSIKLPPRGKRGSAANLIRQLVFVVYWFRQSKDPEIKPLIKRLQRIIESK